MRLFGVPRAASGRSQALQYMHQAVNAVPRKLHKFSLWYIQHRRRVKAVLPVKLVQLYALCAVFSF